MSNDSSNNTQGWGPLAAITGVLASFAVSQLLASLLVTALPSVLGWSQSNGEGWLSGAVAQFMYVLLAEGISLVILWLFWRRYRGNVRVLLGLGKFRLMDILYAFAGIVVYFGIYFVVLSIVNAVVPIDTTQEQSVGFSGAAGSSLLLAFISLVILPPIVEEITFRGYLYSGLKRRWGVVAAITLTSLVFGALHTLTGKDGLLWIAAIDTFALSLVLCYLREKTGNLYASMGVHAIKNGIAFLALFVLHLT